MFYLHSRDRAILPRIQWGINPPELTPAGVDGTLREKVFLPRSALSLLFFGNAVQSPDRKKPVILLLVRIGQLWLRTCSCERCFRFAELTELSPPSEDDNHNKKGLLPAMRLNQQATKRDVDLWMEDLLIRIQLRIMHPHNIIDQEGGRIGEDARVLQLGAINVNKLLLDGFTPPNTPGELRGWLPKPLHRLQQKQSQEPETAGERRQYRRYAVNGNAELHTKSSDKRSWGFLSDLSASGCYVEMYFPPVARTEVKMTLEISEARILAEGIVRVGHPSLGVGIEFTNMTDEYRQRLSELLHSAGAH